ncbi:DUF5681 domain-containing protein [Sediminimonas qiaohouensis]|uniref:DUF5681 domain-containing protein n=1 Tax=Sediminimonas qiaohouensis TaxID=552061 RepID=UPI000425E5ED|nr:DUF5681 domain-containing protein [Sediminimonas qiaohouensis]
MTTSDDNRDYEVGYGKPPKHTRFKKGQSGNPKGRPKETRNVTTILRERFFSPVTITENGRRKQIPIFDALIRTLFKDGLEGDPRAQDRLIKLIHMVEADSPASDEAPDTPEIDGTDEAILRHFIEMGGAELLDTVGPDTAEDETS